MQKIVFITIAVIAIGLSVLLAWKINDKEYLLNPTLPTLPQQESSPMVSIFFEPWQHDPTPFRMGLNLINASEPQYEKALELFLPSIEKASQTRDIDYEYAWAAFCLAKLKRFDECLKFYRIIRQRFNGKVIGGASGAMRIWDDKLNEIKNIIAADSSPEAQKILQEMLLIDQTATISYPFLYYPDY